MRKIILVSLFSLFATTSYADDYSAICNCAGFKTTFGITYLVKGVVAGGSGGSVGTAIQSAARQCFIGLYKGTCKVFLNGQLVFEED